MKETDCRFPWRNPVACLAPVAVAASLFCLPLSVWGEDESAWYQRHRIGIEVGPTGVWKTNDPRYASKFNGREIVKRSREAGCEYVVIWARDGEWVYYDSTILPKCPGLGDRDVLRETLDEARKYEMPVIAYCVVQYGSRTLRENSTFEMRGADGGGLGRLCLNSGYISVIKSLLDEMLAYGVDGFHVDMLDQGFGPPHGCWCSHCRSLFREKHGHEMPAGVSWDAAWDEMLEFRYDTCTRFEKAVVTHVRSRSPGVSVDFNYHGYPPFSWEIGQRPVEHAHIGDFVTAEAGTWAFGALSGSLTAEFLRATKPGGVYQIAIQRGLRMYHDQTTRPVNDLRWEVLGLLAHGAQVTMIDKTPYDGSLDPVAWERMGVALREGRALGEHFGHSPVYDVGIWYSARSRDWYGRSTPARYQQAFTGAHRAFVHEHVQAGVVLDENATLQGLEVFPVVCLANSAILSERDVGSIREYVEGGGNLVVTAQSGQFDRLGEPAHRSSLEELIGARRVSLLESRDNHISLPEVLPASWSGIDADIRRGWPFLVYGPAIAYEPTTAESLGVLQRPDRTPGQKTGEQGTDLPMSAGEKVGPALLLNRVGRGKVLTLACSPGFATGSDYPVLEARKLLRNAVRILHPAPRVRVSAPSTVEVVTTDDPERRTLRVHLLGYSVPPSSTPPKNRPYVLPGHIESAPIFRVRLSFRDEIHSLRALDSGTVVTQRGRTVRVLVEDVHEVLVLKY